MVCVHLGREWLYNRMKELSRSGLVVYSTIGEYFLHSSSSTSSLFRTTWGSKWSACLQVGDLSSMPASIRPNACSIQASCIAFICQALGCITLGAVHITATGCFGKVAGRTDVVVARAAVGDDVVVMLASLVKLEVGGGRSTVWCALKLLQISMLFSKALRKGFSSKPGSGMSDVLGSKYLRTLSVRVTSKCSLGFNVAATPIVSSTSVFGFCLYHLLVPGLWIHFHPHLMVLVVLCHCLNHFPLLHWLLLVSSLPFHTKTELVSQVFLITAIKAVSCTQVPLVCIPSVPTIKAGGSENFPWFGSPFFSVLSHSLCIL